MENCNEYREIALSQLTVEDIKFGIRAGFDYIAASFVRNEQDVLNIRKVLQENGGEHIKIISKIENRQGIDNFDSILKVSDGIMVARGDLGVEIPMEEVPIRQKEFISKCNRVGKPVVIATQMLETMIYNSRPTRAEITDDGICVFRKIRFKSITYMHGLHGLRKCGNRSAQLDS